MACPGRHEISRVYRADKALHPPVEDAVEARKLLHIASIQCPALPQDQRVEIVHEAAVFHQLKAAHDFQLQRQAQELGLLRGPCPQGWR